MTITDLQPAQIWSYFNEINQVPRPSKKEAKILAYLKNFAESFHLKFRSDEIGNLIIEKEATVGFENRPKVVLQSHIDMVCEKNSDSKHNFETDPIETFIDGDWLKAKGTTLGADNGIGMAAQLAVLAANDISHGPLECLFTVDEETGLTGAFALKPDFVSGRILLNLDSEDEGEIFIGCAGGIDTTAYLSFCRSKLPKGLYYFSLKVSGLTGGHSGDDINKGFANANQLLARFLHQCNNQFELTLCQIDGGNLHNAIPREAFALCAVPFAEKEFVRIALNHYLTDLHDEFHQTEPKLKIDLESENQPDWAIDKTTSEILIKALYIAPNGVVSMSKSIPDLVETSTNLASVKMLPNNQIKIVTSQRSSIESAKYDIAHRMETLFSLIGANVTHGDGYPGWTPNPDSPTLLVAKKTHKQLFGHEPRIKAIHAGLECGLFSAKYPGLDMISFGPTMRGVHSPDERLHIPSVDSFWKFLIALLENISE